MPSAHVFVETNFLFGVFRMPSKRRRDALALKARFEAGEVKLYVPYLCFQEARHLVSKSLPRDRCADLREFHRFVTGMGATTWNFDEVKKLLDAATAEVSRTKAVHPREIGEFATALGDGILHGTKEVFDFLEALDLDGDSLKYNDKLILASVLWRAKELKKTGERHLFFASVDKGDLDPKDRPKMARYYNEAGLVFIPGFVLPELPTDSVGQSAVPGAP